MGQSKTRKCNSKVSFYASGYTTQVYEFTEKQIIIKKRIPGNWSTFLSGGLELENYIQKLVFI